MKKIAIYPKAELLALWEADKAALSAQEVTPVRCLRCGRPMNRELAENALSRALDVHVCSVCGADEAMRDYAGEVLPATKWYAVENDYLPELEQNDVVILTSKCAFPYVFTGPKKSVPLTSNQYPVGEVAYFRSDYDGHQWWRTWHPCTEEKVAPELATEMDSFADLLLKLPEFQTLWHLQRACKVYAEPTSEPTEFNLYGESEYFYIWLRLITRERDYNLYCHFYGKAEFECVKK